MASTTNYPKDVFGNVHKGDQQRHSTSEPLSTEGGARMASTTKSPRHFLKDVFGNWHKEDHKRHSTNEPLSTEGGARIASMAFFEGCLWK